MLTNTLQIARSYLFKIIMLVAISGIVPALVLGIFAYNHITNTAKERAEAEGAHSLQQLQEQFEYSMRTTEQLAGTILSSPSTYRATQQYLTERDFETVFNLQNSLLTIQTFSPKIVNVQLISLEHEWIITSNENRLSNNDNVLDDHIYEFAQDLRTSYWKRESQQSEHLISINKIPHYAEKPTGLLLITLTLNETLELPDSRIGKLTVLDINNELIAGSPLPVTMDLKQYMLAHPNQKEGQLTIISEDDQSLLVKYRVSSWNGNTYVYTIDTFLLHNDSRKIAKFVLYLCLGVIVFIIAFTYFGSRRLYNPIGQLYSNIFGVHEALLNRRRKTDELSMIGERVNYLMNSDIQLKAHWPQVKEFTAHKIFNGEISYQEWQEKMDLLGYSKQWMQHSVLVIQLGYLTNTRFMSQDKDLLFFSIQNIITELLPEKQRIGPVISKQGVIVLVGIEDDRSYREETTRIGQLIKDTIKHYLNLIISVGISNPISNVHEAPIAYEQALRTMKYHDRLEPELVISYSDIDIQGFKAPYYPLQQENMIIEAIRAADLSTAKESLHVFLKQLFAQPSHTGEYEVALMRLLVSILRSFQESFGNVKDLYEEEGTLFGQLVKLGTLEEIEIWYSNIVLTPIINQLKEMTTGQYQSIAQDIVGIIRDKYDCDLNLEYCAERLNYNPSYLGRIFKREMGIGFADYLSEYRLSISKQWLIETNMTLAEISEKLNYHNPPNFSRYFKKMVGTSPGKFRELNRKDYR